MDGAMKIRSRERAKKMPQTIRVDQYFKFVDKWLEVMLSGRACVSSVDDVSDQELVEDICRMWRAFAEKHKGQTQFCNFVVSSKLLERLKSTEVIKAIGKELKLPGRLYTLMGVGDFFAVLTDVEYMLVQGYTTCVESVIALEESEEQLFDHNHEEPGPLKFPDHKIISG